VLLGERRLRLLDLTLNVRFTFWHFVNVCSGRAVFACSGFAFGGHRELLRSIALITHTMLVGVVVRFSHVRLLYTILRNGSSAETITLSSKSL
jgi:hypothetical protein